MADLAQPIAAAAPGAPAEAPEGPAEVMMQFISLGQNCEFGFAQRAFGAEPLDLLRWASTPLHVLIDLLRNRFAGIGDPEQIRVYHPPNREYMIEHTGYRFIWHAFAKEGEATAEELKRRECRRLPRLAEILMDHLTEGRRICVIKRDNGLTPEHLMPLMTAIRGYGASPVLLVHCTDDAEKIGTVRHLGGGLFLGFLERFSDPAEVPSTTDAKGWLALCRNMIAELRKPDAQRTSPGRYAGAAEAEGQARPADGADVEATLRAWATREIAFWQSRDLRHEIVMDELRSRHGTREMEFLFEIRNGDIVPAPKAPATPDRVPIWRPPMYERFLREVVRQHCPELETALLINVADGGPARESVPIFAFQKPRGGSALLLPDVDFLQFDFYRGNADFVDDTPYDVKSCSAVFVGKTTGALVTRQVVADRSLPRLRSAMFFRDKPEVDFRLPEITNATDEAKELLLEMGFGRRDRLSYKQQFEHKFIISMDGFGATCSRVAIALRSNCVLLKYNSNNELYYFDGLRPWVHYLPVSKDEDVMDFISAERKNPGTFADVARNGREFAERYLTRQQAAKYTAGLLRAYVSLFRDSDDKAGGASGAPEVRVLAHFANVGDVWLAPGTDDMKIATKIEGFALRTIGGIRPSDIEYQGLQADGCMTGLFRGGEFCGSRGKATPLLGFAARLSAQAGGDWCCEYVGHFADGSRVGPLRQGEICRAESGAALKHMEMQIVPRAHMTENDEHQAVGTCAQEIAIDFSREGNGRAFVGEGWSAQEAGHIWSVGPRSNLAIPRLDPRCRHQLIFDMAPYVAPGGAPTARVGLFAGERHLGEFELAGVRQSVEVFVPAGSIPSSGRLLLRLEHPDFSRPAEQGHRDGRPLGICMFKLAIRQSGGDATPEEGAAE